MENKIERNEVKMVDISICFTKCVCVCVCVHVQALPSLLGSTTWLELQRWQALAQCSCCMVWPKAKSTVTTSSICSAPMEMC